MKKFVKFEFSIYDAQSRQPVMVDLNHVLTLLNVLNERSIVHVAAGVANAIQSAVWTAAKRTLFCSKSISDIEH